MTSTTIKNPHTGRVVVGPETGHTVEVIDPPDYAPLTTDVWIKVKPSFRPGMPHDLGTYPKDWVVTSDD